MSGKGSRQRRVDAVNNARKDLIANRGGEMVMNRYTDERQARIYAQYYAKFRTWYGPWKYTQCEVSDE